MDTFDHEGNFIASIDIREESDVSFLEQLFRNFQERQEIVSGVRKDVTDVSICLKKLTICKLFILFIVVFILSVCSLVWY